MKPQHIKDTDQAIMRFALTEGSLKEYIAWYRMNPEDQPERRMGK